MNPERQRVEAIFEAALACGSEADRRAYLTTACPDAALRLEVETLLEAHRDPDSLFAEADSGVGRGPAPAAFDEVAGTVIGRYKLLQKIGEGGMGVVYMAEQRQPVVRKVALKIIKLGMDTKQVVARFEAERQALALMDHPNIAKVLDGGATDTGRPYFVMELVQGVPITEFCDKNRLQIPERLKLFLPVCQAIQSAHQKGVIHRDIKPTNVLVTLNAGKPVPLVIDFGVAKATNQRLTEKTVFTSYATMIGTPAYMSPEQAEMSRLDVDTRSDIYSLGVLLYELLTGTTPVPEKRLRSLGYNEMQRIILEEEPERPSTRLSTLQGERRDVVAKNRGASELALGRNFAGDLDWIVMKCLEKDRARRYETANGLARDLERHLDNEPVSARPPSPGYRFQKFVRRNKLAVSAATAVTVVLVLGVLVSTWEAVRATHMRKRAEANEQKALAAQANEATQRRRAEAGEEQGRRLGYAGKMNMAQVAWEQNRVAQLRQLLDDTADYPDRGFEWYYWQRQAHLELKTLRGHTEAVGAVGFSPDGRRIITGSVDTTAKVWDAATGNEMFTLKGHLHEIDWVAFSPDGQRIVTGSMDTTARIWDAASGQWLLTLEGHRAQVASAAFSPDSRRVVTGSWDGTAQIWDATTGNRLVTLQGHMGRVHSALFSPDGRRIVTGGDDETARIWDALSGKEILRIKAQSGAVSYAAFSPDGGRIVTGGDQDPTATVWDASTGEKLAILAGHEVGVGTALFSSDGQRVATAGWDRTARLWSAATGKELLTIKGPGEEVTDVAVSPDGALIVTGSDDRTASVWDTTGQRDVLTFKGHTRSILTVGFSPDGKRVVTGGGSDDAEVWDAGTGRVLFALLGHGGPVRCAAFSPDGQRIVTGDGQGASLWDAATGKFLFNLEGCKGGVGRLAFAPDSQRILTGGTDGIATLWDAATGKPRQTFHGHTEGITGVAFSPDGGRIVTASADRTAKVWDVATGRVLTTLSGHEESIRWVAFSPDGHRLLTGSGDRTARVWDSSTGKQILRLRGHSAWVQCVAFSPDGLRLVTASGDQTAKIWDAVTGAELLTLKGHRRWVHSVAFSPDGTRVITGSDDGTAKVWQAAMPNQVAAWQEEEKNAQERWAALSRQQAAADQEARELTARDPGAISQWLVLGPLTFLDYSATRLAEEQIVDEAGLHPSAGQSTRAGASDWVWQTVQLDDYRIDFERVFKLKAPWSVAYLVAYIESDAAQTNLSMRIGGSEAKVHLNGKEIYRYDKPRKYIADQDVVGGLTLNAGLNVLVFKAEFEYNVDKASIRFTDAAGEPVKGINVTLTPASGR
jgi:WD40 repeat protein/serine/threonine protein kinase